MVSWRAFDVYTRGVCIYRHVVECIYMKVCQILIRVTEDEKASWSEIASAEKCSLSELVRSRVTRAASIDANPGRVAELEKIIAEKDAEIARLKALVNNETKARTETSRIQTQRLLQAGRPIPPKPCENPKCACKKCVKWEREHKWSTK